MIKKMIMICCFTVLLLYPSQMYATTVVIDPGHGGHDPGAIGVNGLMEKFVNMDISNKLAKELHTLGYTTFLTRETDISLTLQERVKLANQSEGDLFVSIHANAHKDNSARGTLVLYYDDTYQQVNYPASSAMRLLSDENKKLATSIQSHMIQQVNMIDRGIVPSGVYVVRKGIMPSVLVETAFISNKEDASLLAADNFRAEVASAIAQGIHKYLPPTFYDLNNHWAKTYILQLESLGIVSGDHGAFYPNRHMTRAEFLAILDRVFSFDELLTNKTDTSSQQGETVEEIQVIKPEEIVDVENMVNADDVAAVEEADHVEEVDNVEDTADVTDVKNMTSYSDLSDTHWAFSTINKAIDLGIVSGYKDRTIRPNTPITRAEMVVLFDRLALTDTSGNNSSVFTDVPEQSWYSDSVYKLQELGFVYGVTDSTFAPSRVISRAEGATIITRYLNSELGLLAMNNLKPNLMH